MPEHRSVRGYERVQDERLLAFVLLLAGFLRADVRLVRTDSRPFFAASTDALSAAIRSAGCSSTSGSGAVTVPPFRFALITAQSASR